MKYLATSKIDAPSAHIIRNYSYRWRIETFFEDSKQELGLGLGLGDCGVRDSDGASRSAPENLLRNLIQNLVIEWLLILLRRTDGSKCFTEYYHWHLQMLTDSLLRLGSESSVSERLVSKASSLRAQLEHGLKETVYNMFLRVRDQQDHDLEGLMEEIDRLFLHSEGSL